MPVPAEITQTLSEIREAESNIPANEMKLIERVTFDNGVVSVKYHCVSPFCPMMLVLAMGLEMKQALLKLDFVRQANVAVVNHYMADSINSKIEGFEPNVC
jgi:metal-sulfur cluster biosynthetic enzyme